MNEQEKSVNLARVVGWLTTDDTFHSYHPPSGAGASVNHTKGYAAEDIFKPPLCKTLYAPENMALAWRVLNWALMVHMESNHFNEFFVIREKLRETLLHLWGTDFAQTVWLDKILELSTEAGMVQS